MRGEAQQANFLKVNPNWRIPALVDGDFILFESLAINTYIAKKAAGALAPKALTVSANGDRLRQALINLLSNAIKYNTALDPRITIRPGITLAGAVIDVIDNGGGVSAQEAETIFEKFTRGDRAGAERGASLGLPISRAIMRAMDGDLTVAFAPDGASFFRLHLTLAPA
jgi:signal transduction histidine kinase